MKKTLLIPFSLFVILLLSNNAGWAQTAEELHQQSQTELQNQNYKQGIELMDLLIEKYPGYKDIPMIYLNRATAKSFLKDYNGAMKDYTSAYEKNPKYAEAVRQRGYLKKEMGDFKAALMDYDLALKIDSTLAEAYVNRAIVLDTLAQREEACKSYEKALDLGITAVARIIFFSCDSNAIALQKYSYTILVDKTTDKTYGYSKDNPIKVGHGPRGQRSYLSMLRDGQGNKVEYERAGSAGSYPSKNGMMGMAMVDAYIIRYKNEKGKEKKTTLFLSFYDYVSPKIPVGFYSTEDFKK